MARGGGASNPSCSAKHQNMCITERIENKHMNEGKSSLSMFRLRLERSLKARSGRNVYTAHLGHHTLLALPLFNTNTSIVVLII